MSTKKKCPYCKRAFPKKISTIQKDFITLVSCVLVLLVFFLVDLAST